MHPIVSISRKEKHWQQRNAISIGRRENHFQKANIIFKTSSNDNHNICEEDFETQKSRKLTPQKESSVKNTISTPKSLKWKHQRNLNSAWIIINKKHISASKSDKHECQILHHKVREWPVNQNVAWKAIQKLRQGKQKETCLLAAQWAKWSDLFSRAWALVMQNCESQMTNHLLGLHRKNRI